MPLSSPEWLDRLAAQLAQVVGALVERPAAAAPGAAEPLEGWVATIAASGGIRGALSVEFDRRASETLVMRMMGLDAPPVESVVANALKEVCSQAIAALVQEAQVPGAHFSVERVERAAFQGGAAFTLKQIAVEGMDPLRLRLWGEVQPTAPSPAPPTPDAALTAAAAARLDVILDIDLPLVVRFGRTEMSVRALSALAPGSVLDLGRPPEEAVEVLVSNQVVARGEVVVVGGNYGVRITSVVSAAERMRSVEAGT